MTDTAQNHDDLVDHMSHAESQIAPAQHAASYNSTPSTTASGEDDQTAFENHHTVDRNISISHTTDDEEDEIIHLQRSTFSRTSRRHSSLFLVPTRTSPISEESSPLLTISQTRILPRLSGPVPSMSSTVAADSSSQSIHSDVQPINSQVDTTIDSIILDIDDLDVDSDGHEIDAEDGDNGDGNEVDEDEAEKLEGYHFVTIQQSIEQGGISQTRAAQTQDSSSVSPPQIAHNPHHHATHTQQAHTEDWSDSSDEISTQLPSYRYI